MTDHPCPCRYSEELGAIVFCSLHSSAGELLEACRDMIEAVNTIDGSCAICLCTITEHAGGCVMPFLYVVVKKAEGR